MSGEKKEKKKITAAFKPERLVKRMETQSPPLTARELGKMTGVSSSTIGFLKSGKTAVPRSDTLAILCYALGINPLDLFEFGGVGEEAVKQSPPAEETVSPEPGAVGDTAEQKPVEERKVIRHKKQDGKTVEAPMLEDEPDEEEIELSEAVDGILDDQDEEEGGELPDEKSMELEEGEGEEESADADEPKASEVGGPEQDDDDFDDVWDFGED